MVIKKEVMDLSAILQTPGQVATFKLDAWKVTLYMVNEVVPTPGAFGTTIFFDGATVGAFGYTLSGVGPFVMKLGGLVVDGKPVLIDDELTVRLDPANFTTTGWSLVMVKEYVVPGAGPDQR